MSLFQNLYIPATYLTKAMRKIQEEDWYKEDKQETVVVDHLHSLDSLQY